MTTSTLTKRLDRLRERIAPRPEPEIRFTCYWQGEAIPDDGSPVIVTSWGRPVNDKEDRDEDEY